MTAEQIDEALRILEVQYHHGMPYVEYERKKRQLENKRDVLCDETNKEGNKDSKE